MTGPIGQPLRLSVRQVGSAMVLGVRGSAGMDAAEKLRLKLEELAAKQAPVIVVDLSGMDFICSLGLGAIISGHLKCRHHNGQIKLVNPQQAVMQLLETTRLTKLFPIYSSVDQALSS